MKCHQVVGGIQRLLQRELGGLAHDVEYRRPDDIVLEIERELVPGSAAIEEVGERRDV